MYKCDLILWILSHKIMRTKKVNFISQIENSYEASLILAFHLSHWRIKIMTNIRNTVVYYRISLSIKITIHHVENVGIRKKITKGVKNVTSVQPSEIVRFRCLLFSCLGNTASYCHVLWIQNKMAERILRGLEFVTCNKSLNYFVHKNWKMRFLLHILYCV